jgi:hypothetical protein
MMLRSRWWSFLLPIVLFTLACSLAAWGILHFSGLPMSQLHWGIISYFMLLTAILHAWQEHALSVDPKGFVRRFIAGLTIKMLISLVMLVMLLLFLPREEAAAPMIMFILLYLAYLGFSTGRMSYVLRQHRRT